MELAIKKGGMSSCQIERIAKNLETMSAFFDGTGVSSITASDKSGREELYVFKRGGKKLEVACAGGDRNEGGFMVMGSSLRVEKRKKISGVKLV